MILFYVLRHDGPVAWTTSAAEVATSSLWTLCTPLLFLCKFSTISSSSPSRCMSFWTTTPSVISCRRADRRRGSFRGSTFACRREEGAAADVTAGDGAGVGPGCGLGQKGRTDNLVVVSSFSSFAGPISSTAALLFDRLWPSAGDLALSATRPGHRHAHGDDEDRDP